MQRYDTRPFELSIKHGPRILAKGASRVKRRAAWKYNLTSATVVADMLKPTLGPGGYYKLFKDPYGVLTLSGDGATILQKIKTDNPVVKLLIEMGKAINNEVGDGVSTAVVLVGALLEQAAKLYREKIHPSIIVSGYLKASEKALEILRENAIRVDKHDVSMLVNVARTTLDKQLIGIGSEHLAMLSAEAVIKIMDYKGWNGKLSPSEDIQLIPKAGGEVVDSQLIEGVIIDKSLRHPLLPTRVKDAKIALVDKHMRIEKTKNWSELRIVSPIRMREFIENETNMLHEMAEKIKSVGANVIFCQKSIDDKLLYFLGRYGIMAVRGVHRRDFEMLAKATHARITVNVWELTPEHLGYAGLVEERDVGAETWVFVEKCKNPGAVSILIRGSMYKWAEEIKNRVKDALMNLSLVIEDGRVVAGGGAVESEIARELRRYSPSLPTKEQLVVNAFANALEEIPKTIAANSGLDPLDVITEIRKQHDEGVKSAGVDVRDGKVKDMFRAGVVDPFRVKELVIKAATEIACSIIRIDEIIWAAYREWSERPKMTEKSIEWSREGMIGQPGSYPTYGEPY